VDESKRAGREENVEEVSENKVLWKNCARINKKTTEQPDRRPGSNKYPYQVQVVVFWVVTLFNDEGRKA
jgi:hypothetical protein